MQNGEVTWKTKSNETLLENIVKSHYKGRETEGYRAFLVAIDAFKIGYDAGVEQAQEVFRKQVEEAAERSKQEQKDS
jgi:hypothetical protein